MTSTPRDLTAKRAAEENARELAEDPQRVLRSGFQRHLAKPIQEHRLLDAVGARAGCADESVDSAASADGTRS